HALNPKHVRVDGRGLDLSGDDSSDRFLVSARVRYPAEEALTFTHAVQLVAGNETARIGVLDVVSPAPAAQLGERPARIVLAHDDVGEVERAIAVARLVQNRRRQEAQHARLLLKEPNVGKAAEEGDVDRGFPQLVK